MKFAIVKIIDEKSPFWKDASMAYLTHVQTYKAKNTIRCVDRPSINAFTGFVGNPRIGEITQERIDKWVGHLKMTLSPSSARTRIITVRLVFLYALDEGWIASNPFRGLKLPPQTFGGRILTDEEIGLLLSLLDDQERRACVLSLYTGLRIGEVLSLDWSDVTGESLTIRAKNSKSKMNRVILLQPKALEALGQRKIGRVFYLSRRRLNQDIAKACKALGLGRIRFHDLRHTAATRFMEQSDDVFALMDAFGWKGPSSAKPYQHMTRTRRERIFGIKYSIDF